MKAKITEVIRSLATETFSRSGGPGGQNVNKVNTRVTLRLPVARLADELGLTESDRERLMGRLPLTEGGDLVIHVSDERSQRRNRELALHRAVEAVVKALARRRRRRPTRPTAASRENRLSAKKRRGRTKRDRGRVDY